MIGWYFNRLVQQLDGYGMPVRFLRLVGSKYAFGGLQDRREPRQLGFLEERYTSLIALIAQSRTLVPIQVLDRQR